MKRAMRSILQTRMITPMAIGGGQFPRNSLAGMRNQ